MPEDTIFLGEFKSANASSVSVSLEATTDKMLVYIYDTYTSSASNTVTSTVKDSSGNVLFTESHVRNSRTISRAVILSVDIGTTYTLTCTSGVTSGTVGGGLTSIG